MTFISHALSVISEMMHTHLARGDKKLDSLKIERRLHRNPSLPSTSRFTRLRQTPTFLFFFPRHYITGRLNPSLCCLVRSLSPFEQMQRLTGSRPSSNTVEENTGRRTSSTGIVCLVFMFVCSNVRRTLAGRACVRGEGGGGLDKTQGCGLFFRVHVREVTFVIKSVFLRR